MPGFILADFYDSAMGRKLGIETAFQVGTLMEGMWALPLLAASGGIGSILALPVASASAWRGRLLPGWALLAVVTGIIGFTASGATLLGNTVLAAGFVLFSVALSRLPSSYRSGALR